MYSSSHNLYWYSDLYQVGALCRRGLRIGFTWFLLVDSQWWGFDRQGKYKCLVLVCNGLYPILLLILLKSCKYILCIDRDWGWELKQLAEKRGTWLSWSCFWFGRWGRKSFENWILRGRGAQILIGTCDVPPHQNMYYRSWEFFCPKNIVRPFRFRLLNSSPYRKSLSRLSNFVQYFGGKTQSTTRMF